MQWLFNHMFNGATLVAVLILGYKLNFTLTQLVVLLRQYPLHLHVGHTIPKDEIIYPKGVG